MAFISRRNFHDWIRRSLSTAPEATLSSRDKSRATLSLLKSEDDPEEIVEICRAASLKPDSQLDRIALSIAISKLSKSNNSSFVPELLDGLPVTRTEKVASRAITLFGKANMLDHAIRTFKEYHGNNSRCGSVKSLNALLFACVSAKKYEQAREIFVEFPAKYGIEPDLETYNAAIRACCDGGSSSSVYSILEEMIRKKMIPDTTSFGLLLSGLYREEKYDEVGNVLKLMKEKYGIKPTASTYDVRIQSLCKLKRSTEAKALLRAMVAKNMQPTAVTFCHLIHGFCKEGDMEEAKRLFENMVNHGCKPDSFCYFMLIYFLCEGKDFDAALEICKRSMANGWFPNFSTMKSLVNGLAVVGKVEEAKTLAAKMKTKFTKNIKLWEEVEAALPLH